ncbi:MULTISPECIES: type II secretion system minor pseudopilin GspK [unclassified Sphingomonas]|uniref:type II secretion system minor pseudopilin GspK n=1 Tax=unclassified Sphingomonas TaxID=196159 RepID=UPI00044E0E52|nr:MULTISPECIES: type II secretion system minor pseudopilin GspK [unclassified Sphingomonas]EZP51851.1 Type II secretion system protein K [Sphingomonas sp. RIT328]
MTDHRERGAALLTVLLLVAMVAVLAGTALERLRLTTRLAGNALAGEQARGYARAAEALATSKVTDMLGTSRDRVTLAGGWSNRPFGLPLPGGGLAVARVRDGGNCFNLNSLVSRLGPGVYTSTQSAIKRVQFVRLMRSLNVPAQAAERIAAASADWIDTDQDQQGNGAEDPVYLARAVPYRTAGTLMADPSELRAVDGVTPEIYATLRPWLCTLPKPVSAPININTLLPEQAPLIAMLFPGNLSVAQAQALLLRRPPQGFSSVDTFLNAAGSGATPDDRGGLSLTSTWFALAIDVSNGTARLQESALIDASRLPARLVARQWGDDS